MNRALIFDTETTDLVKNALTHEKFQPHMTEFYGNVVDENDEIVESLHFMCKPPIKISDQSFRITGINDAMVEGEPAFKENAQKVFNLIGSCDAVVAHNLSFDWSMMEIEAKRVGMTFPWPLTRICTVEQSEWYKGFRLNLAGLHEYLFDKGFDGAHRAKSDVGALTACFIEMRNRGDL